jgi:CarD family transcriptional regulator, regulator of rRNA transcription
LERDYLFKIGDNIVYPMQGAGTVTAIEEKDLFGEKQNYYIINLLNNMQIMIPSEKISAIGIRFVTDSNTLETVLSNLRSVDLYTNESLTYKERYTINMTKIKSGDLIQSSEVIHDLMILEKGKALNSSEKQMLNSAKKLLLSEISLAKGLTEEEANTLLCSSVYN